jgi:hypothetical protein
MEYMHTTRMGSRVALADMTDSHLFNTIQLILRRAEEGLPVRYRCWHVHDKRGQEIWHENRTIHGAKVLDALHYAEYVRELNKRHPNSPPVSEEYGEVPIQPFPF